MEDQLPDPEVKTTHDDWYAQAWETEFGEVLFGNSSERENEEATITELPADDGATTEQDTVITTTNENLTAEHPPSGNETSLNLDVNDNPFIMTPPPIESPPIPPTLPPIVVGYNPRKTERYNLRPNPRPNVHPDFRMLDAVTTEDTSHTQN